MKDQAEIKAALNIVRAIADTIKELGSIPSGKLYSQLAGHLSLSQYKSILHVLKTSGLVSEAPSHLLTWEGDK